MLIPPIWPDLPSATSSPGSAGGLTPCVSPDGQTTGPCGPEARPASLLAPQESSLAETTPAISAPILSAWLGPAAPACCSASKSPARQSSERLQAALESKLRKRLNGRGSMIYATVWKQHVTPLGRQIFRLRALALRTSASEPSLERHGWTTPQAHDTTGRSQGQKEIHGTKHGCACLVRDADFAGWPTPMAGTPAQNGNNEAGNNDSSRKTVALVSGWPTPTTRDHKDGPECLNVPVNALLGREVWKAGWPTPLTNDALGSTHCYSGTNPDGTRKIALKLPGAALQAGSMRLTTHGELLTGSTAAMPSGGQLNPDHSRWLMGYPVAWLFAAPSNRAKPRFKKSTGITEPPPSGVSETPSSRKPRRNSYSRSKTPAPNVFD